MNEHELVKKAARELARYRVADPIRSDRAAWAIYALSMTFDPVVRQRGIDMILGGFAIPITKSDIKRYIAVRQEEIERYKAELADKEG